MPSVHPRVVIDLSEYGREGTVVLSEPTVERTEIFNDYIIERFLNKEERAEFNETPTNKRDEYLKPFIQRHTRTFQTLRMLTYVESAPWHSYDEYFDFATPRISLAITEGIDELNSMNPFVVMDEYHEYDMGMELFKEGIKEGTSNPYIAYYIAYAHFLQNHSKSEWEEMTDTDIALMMSYAHAQLERDSDLNAMKIANNVGRVFGGKEQ